MLIFIKNKKKSSPEEVCRIDQLKIAKKEIQLYKIRKNMPTHESKQLTKDQIAIKVLH